jgi:hypothetical protein
LIVHVAVRDVRPSGSAEARHADGGDGPAELDGVLRQIRDGRASEWSGAERRRWRVIFPQMCEWLPEDERELKRTEFRRLIEAA